MENNNDDNGASSRTLPPRGYSTESSSCTTGLPTSRYHHGHAGTTFLTFMGELVKIVTIQEFQQQPFLIQYCSHPFSSVFFDPAIYDSFQAVRRVNQYHPP